MLLWLLTRQTCVVTNCHSRYLDGWPSTLIRDHIGAINNWRPHPFIDRESTQPYMWLCCWNKPQNWIVMLFDLHGEIQMKFDLRGEIQVKFGWNLHQDFTFDRIFHERDKKVFEIGLKFGLICYKFGWRFYISSNF